MIQLTEYENVIREINLPSNFSQLSNERMRAIAATAIISHPQKNQIYGHVYHLLPNLPNRAQDPQFGETYTNCQKADPKILIIALAIQHLITKSKANLLGEWETTVKTSGIQPLEQRLLQAFSPSSSPQQVLPAPPSASSNLRANLWTPVHTSGMGCAGHFVENYFTILKGRTLIKYVPDTPYYTLSTYQPKWYVTALKCLSYLTVLIPILMIIFKYHQQRIRPLLIKQPPNRYQDLETEFQRLRHQSPQENQKIVWFPHNQPIRNEIYDGKTARRLRILRLLQEQGAPVIRTAFQKWLDGDEQTLIIHQKSIMNCTDFVYFTLFNAGLITKNKIREHYARNPTSTSFYGVSLAQCIDFNPRTGEGHIGDIVIGYLNGVADHMMLLSGKNADGEWTGYGLWRHPIPAGNWAAGHSPEENSLVALQEHERTTLTYGLCRLDHVL